MKNIPVRHIKTEPNFSESFNIREVQHMLRGKDMVQELHRHDYFYILVLSKGKGHHTIDFTTYPIHNYSIFFMRPGQVHQLALKAGSTGYLMQFKTDFYHPNDKAAGQLLRKAGHTNFCQLDAKRFNKLLTVATNIFQEYENKEEGYPEVIKANLGIFFIELVRHRQHRKGSANRAASYEQERLEEFLELLEAHSAHHKEVSHYAGLLNLSNYQLNAITKATLGKTCTEVMNDFCILEAKRYLLATANQVTQIAYHLGYEDVSYFIRFFKKHTGYTPEAFRHNFK